MLRKEEIFSAQERAAEVKERGETKLLVIESEKRVGNKPEIMVGARMQGGINTLLPVVEELLHRNYPISFLADQPAEDTIRKKFPDLKQIPVDPLRALDERNPALILAGNSINGGLGIEFYLEATAQGDSAKGIPHIPTVVVEDYPAASIRGQREYTIFPDVVCAFDEGSRDVDIARLKEDPSGKGQEILKKVDFIITGSPVFDEIARETDREATNERVRSALGVGFGDTMISFVGGMPPNDLEDLKILIDNLNKIDFAERRPKFIARIHPAIFKGRLEKYKQAYGELLSQLTSCDVIDTMGMFSTDEIAKTTDVVLSTCSTEGIKAVYREKLSLFMLFPDLGQKVLKDDSGLGTLPVIESGASIGVFSKKDLESQLRELLLDPNVQNKLREAAKMHHHLDGKNTERVVEVIENMLKKQIK